MTEEVAQGLIHGVLHHPEGSAMRGGIVLAHGAGSNRDSRLLTALATGFAQAGSAALRIDLPFRQQRPSGPPYPAIAGRDREGLREAARFMKRFGKVLLAGHSYGGRQASMLVSEDPSVADGLVLFSYPLHPPRKPDQLRTAHFEQIQTRALFVHGAADPFGSPEEMRTAIVKIPAPTDLNIIDKAGHELKPVLLRPQAVVDYVISRSAT